MHVIPGRGCVCGVVGVVLVGSTRPADSKKSVVISGSGLGRPAADGESPVRENPTPVSYFIPIAAGSWNLL